MGRSLHNSAWEWDRNPSSCFTSDSHGNLFYDSYKISSDPVISGYDKGFKWKETGGRRPVSCPDLICIHCDPCGNGKSCGRCRCNLRRWCRCGVLDVDLRNFWLIHSLCGSGFSPALQRERSALQRISRRPFLLYPQLCGACEKEKIKTVRCGGPVRIIRSDLLGWDQPGDQ